MPNYNIAALKAAQDQRKAREAALLERFHEFRDGFFERLDQFTQEALAAGLEGVRRFTRKKVDNDNIEVRCYLNGFDLTFIASDIVDPLEPGGDTFAARILMYPQYVGYTKPLIDVTAQEHKGIGYIYTVRAFRSDGEPQYPKAGSEVSQHTGPLVADDIIDFLYAFETYWSEQPTLEEMTSGKGRERRWGFVPSS